MNIINKCIVKCVELMPKSIVYIFAKKYVAGSKLEDAVNVVKDFNSRGIVATMDILGEAIKNKEEAAETKKHCLQILEAIEENKLNANLSIKPTSLGLEIDKEFCYEQTKEIVELAKKYNNFVRIDMEDSPFTDDTINMFLKLRAEFENVGIVLQAYMRRTYDDAKMLNQKGGHYRLCKGIYVEPEEIAYKGKQEVRDNFMKTLELMLDEGNYVGIATHDKYLVEASYKMLEEKKIPKDKYEFQMLYGVKSLMRERINKDGHLMRIYVPYGEQWYAYSIRRLQENPNMAWHITKSILTFGR